MLAPVVKTDPRPTARLRTLLADDAHEASRSIRLMLTQIPGVDVVAVAMDGQQAVSLSKVYRPDVAIVDINMPVMDGLHAIREMVQTNPDMSCIVISTEHDRRRLRQAMAAGARDFLMKPFTERELVDAINRAADVTTTIRRRTKPLVQRIPVSESKLLAKASEYAKSRRADDSACAVFEALAANPTCDRRWLKTLAMVYVVRQEWHKLARLAQRLGGVPVA